MIRINLIRSNVKQADIGRIERYADSKVYRSATLQRTLALSHAVLVFGAVLWCVASKVFTF